MSRVKITDNTDKVKDSMDDGIYRALSLIGVAAEAHAKLNMNRPMPHSDGTSRPYIDTGNLRNSINNIVQDKAAYIGTNVEYGIYIHEGTMKIAPNRFLRDAVVEHIDEYKRILDQTLKSTSI